MVSYCDLPEPVVVRRQVNLRRENKIDMIHFIAVYIAAIVILAWPKA